MTDARDATLLADRSVLRLAGDDPRDFLQGLVTHDMAALSPVTPLYAGLLTPQGKLLFDFLLWDGGEAVLIDCEATQAEALTRRLALYRLRRTISIEPVADAAVHWAPAGEWGVADPRLADLGRRWIGGGGGASAPGWLAHRLRLGVTEGVAEHGNGDTLWLECNARELHGVSFTKGCYVGQENTARMHHRARINRRLAVAPVDPAGEPPRAQYPALGLMVERRAVADWCDALMPAWLAPALLDQRPTDE